LHCTQECPGHVHQKESVGANQMGQEVPSAGRCGGEGSGGTGREPDTTVVDGKKLRCSKNLGGGLRKPEKTGPVAENQVAISSHSGGHPLDDVNEKRIAKGNVNPSHKTTSKVPAQQGLIQPV